MSAPDVDHIALNMPALNPARDPAPARLALITGDAPRQRRGGITRLTVDVPAEHSASDTKPARWRTPEFFFYYVACTAAVLWMIWVPVRFSSRSHPNYNLYRHRLAPGWLFGREIDASDAQARSFRYNLGPLAGLIAVFFALRLAYERPFRAPADHTHRAPFYVLFALLMLGVLHGASALKVLALAGGNYALARATGGARAGVPLAWAYNCAVLLANERYGGYAFGSAHPRLAFLDEWRGVYPRWHVSFNITMLRLLSFSIDYHWACRHTGPPVDPGPPDAGSDRPRAAAHHPRAGYSLLNYLAYAFYAPLYIAGPIMTFNDFLWQMKRPKAIARGATARYAVRFGVALLVFEAVLHGMHVVAIKDARAWGGLSPAQLSMVGIWNLIVVWLKLLLPWRLFRLWALADGVDPPENMLRCVANNYSALGFWRAWHRSYNRWLVRYLYVPLGGGARRAPAAVLVFTFVALWHDLSARLLAWGWLAALFILPEVLARRAVPASLFGDRWWYRHVCVAGGVFNMLLLAGANLVGFVLGTDGMQHFLHELVGSWDGIRFLCTACAALFVGVQLMFEYREEELRRGIQRRC